MGDDRVEGQMIEIGDPTDEAAPGAAPPPPQVVIEYRDRGVPWMLVPPLLALSAAAAVLAYPRLVPTPTARPIPAPVAEAPTRLEPSPVPTPTPTEPAPAATASPFELALNPPPAGPVAIPAPIEPEPAPVVPPASPDHAPIPRIRGLGFDPRGLEVPAPALGTPADPGVLPAAAEEGPAPVARDEPPAQPEEVDPDLLPPDPRLAQIQRRRRAAEAKRKIEDERGAFHAELRAICRKFGDKAAPEIDGLCKKYAADVDPEAKVKAIRILTVSAAGVDRPVRINLLRSLGFPEPSILRDLFEIQGKWESRASRGGARSADEITVQAARILLSHPPGRVATASRPVSNPRPAPSPAR